MAILFSASTDANMTLQERNRMKRAGIINNGTKWFIRPYVHVNCTRSDHDACVL